jgi:hypothetical protein
MAVFNGDNYTNVVATARRVLAEVRTAPPEDERAVRFVEAVSAITHRHISDALYRSRSVVDYVRAVLALHLHGIALDVYNGVESRYEIKSLSGASTYWARPTLAQDDARYPYLLPAEFWSLCFHCFNLPHFSVHGRTLTLTARGATTQVTSDAFSAFFFKARENSIPALAVLPLFFVRCALMGKNAAEVLASQFFVQAIPSSAVRQNALLWMQQINFNQDGKLTAPADLLLLAGLRTDWIALLSALVPYYKPTPNLLISDTEPDWLLAVAPPLPSRAEEPAAGAGDDEDEDEGDGDGAPASNEPAPGAENENEPGDDGDETDLTAELGVATGLGAMLLEPAPAMRAAPRSYSMPSLMQELFATTSGVNVGRSDPRNLAKMAALNLLSAAMRDDAGCQQVIATALGLGADAAKTERLLPLALASGASRATTVQPQEWHAQLSYLFDGIAQPLVGDALAPVNTFASNLPAHVSSVGPSERVKMFVTALCAPLASIRQTWAAKWSWSDAVGAAITELRRTPLGQPTAVALTRLV